MLTLWKLIHTVFDHIFGTNTVWCKQEGEESRSRSKPFRDFLTLHTLLSLHQIFLLKKVCILLHYSRAFSSTQCLYLFGQKDHWQSHLHLWVIFLFMCSPSEHCSFLSFYLSFTFFRYFPCSLFFLHLSFSASPHLSSFHLNSAFAIYKESLHNNVSLPENAAPFLLSIKLAFWHWHHTGE